MKKIIFVLILFGISSGNALAAASQQGYVIIRDRMDPVTYMIAALNVNTNPKPGHQNSYFAMNADYKTYITIVGYDSDNNNFFYCYIRSTDPVYWTARAILADLTYSSTITAFKEKDNNICTELYHGKDSRLTD